MVRFYAVRDGHTTGIYTTWPECLQQITGFRGARFKSFGTRQQAEDYLNPYKREDNTKPLRVKHEVPQPAVIIYIDGCLVPDELSPRAGWGVFFNVNDPRNFSGKVPKDDEQSQGRGELTAIYEALEFIAKDFESREHKNYVIQTSSIYARDCIGKWAENWEVNGWITTKGTPVRNQDIIKSARQLIEELENQGVNIAVDNAPMFGRVKHPFTTKAETSARDAVKLP